MNSHKSFHSSVILNGILYTLMGNGDDYNKIFYYDLSTNNDFMSELSVTGIPSKRLGCQSAAYNNKIYFWGGQEYLYKSNQYSDYYTLDLSTNIIVDTIADTISNKVSNLYISHSSIADPDNGYAYQIGGFIGGKGNCISDTYKINLESGSYEVLGALYTPSYGHVSVINDNNTEIYKLTGKDQNGNFIANVEKFTIANNTWEIIDTNLGINLLFAKAVYIGNGNIVIYGGLTETGDINNTIYRYNWFLQKLDEMVNFSNIPDGRFGNTLNYYNDELIIQGGNLITNEITNNITRLSKSYLNNIYENSFRKPITKTYMNVNDVWEDISSHVLEANIIREKWKLTDCTFTLENSKNEWTGTGTSYTETTESDFNAGTINQLEVFDNDGSGSLKLDTKSDSTWEDEFNYSDALGNHDWTDYTGGGFIGYDGYASQAASFSSVNMYSEYEIPVSDRGTDARVIFDISINKTTRWKKTGIPNTYIGTILKIKLETASADFQIFLTQNSPDEKLYLYYSDSVSSVKHYLGSGGVFDYASAYDIVAPYNYSSTIEFKLTDNKVYFTYNGIEYECTNMDTSGTLKIKSISINHGYSEAISLESKFGTSNYFRINSVNYYNYLGNPYYESGTFESQIIDLIEEKRLNTFTWNEFKQLNKSVKLQYKLAKTLNELSNMNWYGETGANTYYESDYSYPDFEDPENNQTDDYDLYTGIVTGRYLQYKVTLETDDTTETPYFNAITFTDVNALFQGFLTKQRAIKIECGVYDKDNTELVNTEFIGVLNNYMLSSSENGCIITCDAYNNIEQGLNNYIFRKASYLYTQYEIGVENAFKITPTTVAGGVREITDRDAIFGLQNLQSDIEYVNISKPIKEYIFPDRITDVKKVYVIPAGQSGKKEIESGWSFDPFQRVLYFDKEYSNCVLVCECLFSLTIKDFFIKCLELSNGSIDWTNSDNFDCDNFGYYPLIKFPIFGKGDNLWNSLQEMSKVFFINFYVDETGVVHAHQWNVDPSEIQGDGIYLDYSQANNENYNLWNEYYTKVNIKGITISSKDHDTNRYIIDDIATGENVTFWGGEWQSFSTDVNTIITPNPGKFYLSEDSERNLGYVAKVYINNSQCNTANNLSAGLKLKLSGSNTIDLSSAKGITFYASGSYALITVEFALNNQVNFYKEYYNTSGFSKHTILFENCTGYSESLLSSLSSIRFTYKGDGNIFLVVDTVEILPKELNVPIKVLGRDYTLNTSLELINVDNSDERRLDIDNYWFQDFRRTWQACYHFLKVYANKRYAIQNLSIPCSEFLNIFTSSVVFNSLYTNLINYYFTIHKKEVNIKEGIYYYNIDLLEYPVINRDVEVDIPVPLIDSIGDIIDTSKIIPDFTAIELINADNVDSTTVDATFSEECDRLQSEIISNYRLYVTPLELVSAESSSVTDVDVEFTKTMDQTTGNDETNYSLIKVNDYIDNKYNCMVQLDQNSSTQLDVHFGFEPDETLVEIVSNWSLDRINNYIDNKNNAIILLNIVNATTIDVHFGFEPDETLVEIVSNWSLNRIL